MSFRPCREEHLIAWEDVSTLGTVGLHHAASWNTALWSVFRLGGTGLEMLVSLACILDVDINGNVHQLLSLHRSVKGDCVQETGWQEQCGHCISYSN